MAKKTSSFQAQPDSGPVAASGGRKAARKSSSAFTEASRMEQAKGKARLSWPPPILRGEVAPEWLGMPRGDYPPEEK